MATSESESSYDLLNVSGPLTVETILRTLQQRFNDGHCYTWMGPALLCVNPYEPPSAVTFSVLRQVVQQLLSELAEDSSGGHGSVALVFSGVCGSGKSFTADQLLVKVFQTVQKTEWLQDLRKYWQVSSVVLKALGSAATQSNKDASRIGRMVDFHFKGLQITKVKINCFFLDQSRLVSPNPHEQNYSILYQLLAGLTQDERKKYHLNYHDVHTLHYLSQGVPPKETQQQLQNHFEAWKSSLAQLGIPLTDVVKVLVATLLLGNVLFYEAKNQELSMQGLEELQAVASLLGVDPTLLQQGLTLRTYHSERGEEVRSQCSAAASNGARDALAKALYIRTVVAIMRRINTLLRGASHRSGSASRTRTQTPSEDRSLHIVDLFGWEANEVNSLEHLCINWSAERIQQHYIKSLFIDTIEECTAEGVDPMFESSLYDCGPCIELIGGLQSGLLQLLNQETLSPRVSSDDIRHRIRDRFQTNHCFVPTVASSSTFTIHHFAGDVVYDIYSLLNANADTLADDIISTFNSKDCKFGFVAHLFAVELNRDLRSDGSPQGQMCRITPAYLQHAPHSSEAKQPTTYVQDFQSNIEDVFNVLKNSKPCYVRCIKSNTSQTPGYFDKETVQHQIQYLAVFETVDLIQAGFCHRFPFNEFLVRYRHLSTDFQLSLLPSTRESVQHLLASVSQVIEDIDVSEDNFALGTTKVFLNEEFYHCLERLRQRVLSRAVVKIQAAVRMYLCRKHWPQLKYSLKQARLQGEAHHQLRELPGATAAHTVNGERAYTVRNYTIVGNFKVGFPQWRVMRCHYPDRGPPLLKTGDEVFVLGRSQKRGFLIIEHSGRQIHMPHNYTELRLTPPTSPAPPSVAPPKLARATPPQGYSDL